MPTEVQIVRIGNKSLDMIYLLHPDVPKHGIPDMFSQNVERYKYVTGKAFVIYGKLLGKEEYILSIHPGNDDCNDFTIQEIHAKTYN